MSRNDGTPKAALPLMSVRPSLEVQRQLNSLINYGLLPIEKGVGAMNIDNYRVEITAQPSRGPARTAKAFFSYVRKHLNQFMRRGTCLFTPHPQGESPWSCRHWPAPDFRRSRGWHR